MAAQPREGGEAEGKQPGVSTWLWGSSPCPAQHSGARKALPKGQRGPRGAGPPSQVWLFPVPGVYLPPAPRYACGPSCSWVSWCSWVRMKRFQLWMSRPRFTFPVASSESARISPSAEASGMVRKARKKLLPWGWGKSGVSPRSSDGSFRAG